MDNYHYVPCRHGGGTPFLGPQILTRRSSDRLYKRRWPPPDHCTGKVLPRRAHIQSHDDLCCLEQAKRFQNASMDQRVPMAGVTSALELCMSVSRSTNAAIESWNNTPPLMYALHNEISDLVVLLDSTRAATEGAGLDASKEHAGLLDDVEQPLAEAVRLLTSVQYLVAELLAARDERTRARVLSKNDQAASFQNCLRDVRTRLHNCLLLHNVYEHLVYSHFGRS